jgi:hypothetical protein
MQDVLALPLTSVKPSANKDARTNFMMTLEISGGEAGPD